MNSLPKKIISLILLFLFGFVSNNQAEETNNKLIEMKNFLVAGPLQIKTPAIINSANEKITAKNILEYKYKNIKNWWPKEEDKLYWNNNTFVEWGLRSPA